MCGIAGWVSYDGDLRAHQDVITTMTKTMARRGPDAGGVWIDRHVGLGHRRLAVIDIVGGVQIGTAYLFCPEANVSPLHRQALKTAQDDQTVLTSCISDCNARWSLFATGNLAWLKSRRARASLTRVTCRAGFGAFTASPSRSSFPDCDRTAGIFMISRSLLAKLEATVRRTVSFAP